VEIVEAARAGGSSLSNMRDGCVGKL
jgi:hypothetical protein